MNTISRPILKHFARRNFYAIRHPSRFAKLKKEWKTGRLRSARIAFEEYKCIFVHIPKCAGNSIEEGVFGHALKTGHMGVWWYQLLYSPLEYTSLWKFSIVRNPWDRLLSAFLFLKNGGLTQFDNAWAESHLSKYNEFGHFVVDWVNPRNCNSWIHFKPQHTFIYMDGKLQIEFVGRMETLNDDFEKICYHLGISKELPLLNVNQKKSGHYRDYYDNRTKDIVTNVYHTDIELFDYEF